MRRRDVDGLDPSRAYWVPAVVSPERNWAGAPGCRRGARYMVNSLTLRPSRDEFVPFDSEFSCLRWIMQNRADLNRTLPGARIRAVPLDRWLLGLD
ncbi:hypothetical protein EAH89_01000 [Roseomonas nepalensis]|uniref:Uncharacterized protein n=1 Tax=Muricoccus nepalensis TaxID=1854500 RepID=A0A502GIQ0_9PROT|nr:hypothetical protein [Roseomonas nepalensis]TPG61170.1 hypothetical protein EAH89_01000 [Roseomonas nepalensis]